MRIHKELAHSVTRQHSVATAQLVASMAHVFLHYQMQPIPRLVRVNDGEEFPALHHNVARVAVTLEHAVIQLETVASVQVHVVPARSAVGRRGPFVHKESAVHAEPAAPQIQ